MQLDDRTAGAARPVCCLPFVALQHADVVQRRTSARPEERGPVWVHRRGPATAAARRTAVRVPARAMRCRQSSSPRPGEFATMCCRPATSVAKHHAVRARGRFLRTATHRKPRSGVHRRSTDTPVWKRTPCDVQVFAQRIPQGDIEVGVRHVEDQALAGAEEVDVEHRRQLGGRQVGRFGEEAAGEHLERQMPCGVGEVDVTQERFGVEVVEPTRRCRAPTQRPAAPPRGR